MALTLEEKQELKSLLAPVEHPPVEKMMPFHTKMSMADYVVKWMWLLGIIAIGVVLWVWRMEDLRAEVGKRTAILANLQTQVEASKVWEYQTTAIINANRAERLSEIKTIHDQIADILDWRKDINVKIEPLWSLYDIGMSNQDAFFSRKGFYSASDPRNKK